MMIQVAPTLEFETGLFKGFIAERFVAGLLRTLGFLVVPFGQEAIVPGVLGHMGDDVVAIRVRSSPDLVAVAPVGERTHLLEVKGTTVDDFYFDIEETLEHWPQATIVVVDFLHRAVYARDIQSLEERVASRSRKRVYQSDMRGHSLAVHFELEADRYEEALGSLFKVLRGVSRRSIATMPDEVLESTAAEYEKMLLSLRTELERRGNT